MTKGEAIRRDMLFGERWRHTKVDVASWVSRRILFWMQDQLPGAPENDAMCVVMIAWHKAYGKRYGI